MRRKRFFACVAFYLVVGDDFCLGIRDFYVGESVFGGHFCLGRREIGIYACRMAKQVLGKTLKCFTL